MGSDTRCYLLNEVHSFSSLLYLLNQVHCLLYHKQCTLLSSFSATRYALNGRYSPSHLFNQVVPSQLDRRHISPDPSEAEEPRAKLTYKYLQQTSEQEETKRTERRRQ